MKGCGFGVFSKAAAAGGRVRALSVRGGAGSLSRKDIEALEAVGKSYGGKGLAWFKVAAAPSPDGAVLESGSSKFLAPAEQRALCAATGAGPGDLILAVADSFKVSAAALGNVRTALGRKLGLIRPGELRFTWVIDFPMFERDEESGALSPAHHPFCMPKEQYPGQLEKDPATLPARSYDLVLNGIELGSGSVRIHDGALQHRVFSAIGLPEHEIRERFGFVLDAFKYGAPPHAGFAVGLDRLVMILAGEDSIREVIAFPKTTAAACLMTGAPTEIPDAQLAELGVALRPAAGAKPAGGATGSAAIEAER
jgi:aspartyl-tRNA synthetase